MWKRGWNAMSGLWLALPFAAGAVFANVFPFPKGSNTEVLTILHLPIALWMAVGFAYVRGRWFADGGRMTDDPALHDEGAADEAAGNVQEAVGTAKRKVGEAIEHVGKTVKK